MIIPVKKIERLQENRQTRIDKKENERHEVEKIIGREVEIPEKLKAFMSGRKETIQISKEFSEFKNLLMSF